MVAKLIDEKNKITSTDLNFDWSIPCIQNRNYNSKYKYIKNFIRN